MVNGNKLVLLFLTNIYTVKPPLIYLEKRRQELLNFFVAHGYFKKKGSSTVTVTPVAFYKLS